MWRPLATSLSRHHLDSWTHACGRVFFQGTGRCFNSGRGCKGTADEPNLGCTTSECLATTSSPLASSRSMAASTQRSPTTRLKVKLFPGSLHMSPETYLPGHSLPIKTAFASSPVEIPERRGDSSHSSNSHQSPLCQRGLLSSECNADDHPLEATTKHISAGSSPQHCLRTCEEVSDSDADSRAGSDADSALESEADPSSSDDEAPRPRRTRSRTLLRRSLLSTDSLPNLSSRKRSHALASTSDLQGLDQIEGSTPTERAASARSFADAAWARAREKVAEANRLMAIAQQKAAREQSLVHKKRRCAQQRRGPRDGISYPAHILDGARVSVYWPDDKAFYKGQLLAVDESSNSHLIRYDDDVEEWLCLADERFQWLGPRGRSAGFDMRVKDEMHALGALEVESCASADAEPALTLEEALATPAAAEGAAAVGWRVAVLFVGDGKRYSGEVLAYNAKDKRHLVLYDDGEDEMLNLSMEAVHWLSARNGKSVAAGLPPGEVAPQGEAGIGWRIRVYWPADMQLYRGEVVGYEAETRLHFVQYADGEEEWLQLDREKLCWEQPPPSSDAQDDEDFRPSADSLAGSKAGRKAATGRAGSRAAVAERAAAGRASRAARADAQAGTHSGEAGRPVRVTRNKLIPKKGSASASVLATSLPAKLGDGANSWVSQLLEEPMARRETFGNSLTRSLSHSMGHTLGTPDSPVLNSPILGASGPGFGLRPRLSSGFAPLELAPLEDTMPSGDCSVLSQQQQAQQPQRSDSPAVLSSSYQEGRLSGPNPFDSYLAVSGATRSQAADPNGGVPVTDASMLESLFLDEKQLSDSLDELLDPLSLDQPERCHQPMASSLEAGNPGLDRILGQVGLDNRAFDSCMADEFMWGDDLLRSDTPATRSA
ncbi:hypothetical protein WJX72_011850 [[Myrmecia] bisecta]|uniref:Tudor domain-containing protein n=1 Tax=[Myrmecia] bisecta TaxID=41462 RepID=A0AAW1PM30_9CHLO